MSKQLVIIVLFLSCSGCVRMAFQNDSKKELGSLKATVGQKELEFTNVKSGGKTKFTKVPYAYSSANLNVVYNGETYTLEQKDFVGEHKYKLGKLVMSINVIENKSGKTTVDVKSHYSLF